MTELKGQKEAKRGFKCQDFFINLVNKDSSFNDKLKKAIGISNEKLIAEKPMTSSEKADVMLVIPSKERMGCSIKEAEADFNQLERVWLKNLASDIGMPQEIEKAIQACIDNRRLRKSSVFISAEYSKDIIEYFSISKDTVFNRIFTGNDSSLKYFIVYDYGKKKWYLCRMSDVIEYIKNQPISVSKKGVLYFGDCLTIQKKGGNGKHVKVPKSHPTHPGNQLQFKIKPLSIIRNVKSVAI